MKNIIFGKNNVLLKDFDELSHPYLVIAKK